MSSERWQQVKAIFHEAVECDPARRAQFLTEACGRDEELRREVESLLARSDEPGSLADYPVIAAGAITGDAPGPEPMPGRIIGNYLITGELARGGMGIVYRARHRSLPRDVVVKCIRPVALTDEASKEARVRFRHEAHIQSQLDHPNIVRVFEFFSGAEEDFLVLEYVPGWSIRSRLDRDGVVPPAEACALAIQALDGLAYAHGFQYSDQDGTVGAGVVHRDIKPGNLLVNERGILKVTDFGIAKVLGHEPLTKAGFSLGTLAYMSPEQIRNQDVDARSDLYSLGATLYEMLTGRVPYRSSTGSEYDALKAQIETDPPAIRTLNTEIPQALAEVVTRALNRDPERRWQTGADFREALTACLPGRPATAPSAAGPAPTVERPQGKRRRRFVATGVAALALVAAAVAGVSWFAWRGKRLLPAGEQPSIAVLPFTDMSPEKGQDYFADGLTEELSNQLAQIPGLKVAGRTSSFQFRGKSDDLRAIGAKLHVTTILEGSVRRQGNRARITAQLIKTADGFQLWSKTFDREMNDIFLIQEEIARTVAGVLRVTLLDKKQAVYTTSDEAHNEYLHGRYFLQRRSLANLERAVTHFERAVELDPAYAKAWVGLAESRSGQAGTGKLPAKEHFQKARIAAQRALTLDADLAEAHAAMAWIKQFDERDWTGADVAYKRALALDPGNAIVISHAGILARILGHLDEAVRAGRLAIQIDPLHPGHYHNAGLAMYYAGLYEEAIVTFQKALELHPELEITHCMLGQVYLAQSQPLKALAEMKNEKHAVFRALGLALVHHALGQKKESDANLSELVEKYNPDYQIAEVHAFRGETDRAFARLDLANTNSTVAQLKGDPLLKSLVRDPRFAALLEKAGLPR